MSILLLPLLFCGFIFWSCEEKIEDCLGYPGGTAVYDSCGVCDDDTANDCTQDCAGVWNGDAEIAIFYLDIDDDNLGYGYGINFCDGITHTGWVTNDDDAEPYCNTNNTDLCGVCAGDGSSCADCAGVANGDAYYVTV